MVRPTEACVRHHIRRHRGGKQCKSTHNDDSQAPFPDLRNNHSKGFQSLHAVEKYSDLRSYIKHRTWTTDPVRAVAMSKFYLVALIFFLRARDRNKKQFSCFQLRAASGLALMHCHISRLDPDLVTPHELVTMGVIPRADV